MVKNHRAFAYSALFAVGGGRSKAARGRVVRGMNFFFLNVVEIRDIPLTARRGSWPRFLPFPLGAESSPKEMSVHDTGEA